MASGKILAKIYEVVDACGELLKIHKWRKGEHSNHKTFYISPTEE